MSERVEALSVLRRASIRPVVMLAPTRGRPAGAAELVDAFEETTARTRGASLVLVVDEDDPALPRYEALGYPGMIVGPRLRLGPTLNRWAPVAVELGAEAVGFLGDDHRPRTPGWDGLMLAEVRRGSGGAVVYGDDGFQHERIPTAVVIAARLIALLGWMVPPGMVHLYLDDWWKRLGEDMGELRYLPHVLIEHMHPHAGKGVMDAGYAEVNSAEMYAADGAAFQEYLSQRWPNDRTRLRRELWGMHRGVSR